MVIERPYILKQTCTWKLKVCLKVCVTFLLRPGIKAFKYCRKIYSIIFKIILFHTFTILLLMNARTESDCRKWLFRVNMLGILLLKSEVSFIMNQSHRTWGNNWQTDFKFEGQNVRWKSQTWEIKDVGQRHES